MAPFFPSSVTPKFFNKAAGIALFLVLLVSGRLAAQINVTPAQTATQLAQMLVGPGVVISNPTLSCASNANGIFHVVASNLGIDSGIVLTSGQAATVGTAIGVNAPASLSGSTTTINNTGGDPDLTTLAGVNTFDACKLEFDFVPAGDTIKFDYKFGSEEYPEFACGSVNDVFGFFISGPSITGSANIALIPGTTIPVTVNSVNSAPVGTAFPISTCNNMGPGSPFGTYYINNSTSTTLMYDGTTTILTAIRTVIPCATYHLKLAIADGGDASYDSGVFLKAGSLTSNAISVTPLGGGGLSAPVPYCVRGCLPGQFVFTRPVAKPTPLTIKYQIVQAPTTTYAVNGVDYTFIPDSVVIPANATSVVRQIFGLPMPATGPKIVKLRIYSPYSCGTTTPIIDSAELTIFDSFQVQILTPDTAICRYQTANIRVKGENALTYTWSPAAGLNNPNIKEPIASPLNTTTYTLSATLPGSGCTPTTKQITVSIRQPPAVNVGPDRTTCLGTPFQFNTTVTPANQTYTYSWSPATNLSNANIADPVFTPSAVGTQTYVLTANPGAVGCSGYDTVNVTTLPNDFNLFNHDTAICQGATVQIFAAGDPAFTYSWTPTNNVSNPNIINPSITPDTTRTYTITASYPTCPSIVKSINIDVQPNPIVYVGPDRVKCQWDTLQFHASVQPSWYTHYAYDWTLHPYISDLHSPDMVFGGMNDTTLTFTVTTPAGCKGSDDVNIVVHQGNFASMTPTDTAICPRDSVVLRATGGVTYQWSPASYLTSSTGATVTSYPITNISYTGLVVDQYGCKDTLFASIVVHPEAVMDLGDSVLIYPGESHQMDAKGNCLYFSWFPPLGLSDPNIGNPVAMPEVNTRYFVNGRTEAGCTTTDTVVVMVSTESILGMPNAFSPGSAPNDILKINKRGIATLKYFRIFNRWGVKVFETSDIDQGWDGHFNGAPQPMGVYVYMIEAYTNTGRKFYKQGNVTLIR